MPLHIINPIDDSIAVSIEVGGEYILPAAKNVYIERVSVAVIPHNIKIRKEPGKTVTVTGLVGIMLSHSLWVCNEYVDSGYVNTIVFNLSDVRIKIEKGEAVSRLIVL